MKIDLIERLGGYEKAKTKFRDNGSLHAERMKQALLDYRRQHNIFEEKDVIVFTDSFMHGELMTISWTRDGEVWMDDGAKRCTNLSMIRHAEPEEIQANRRLEVCEFEQWFESLNENGRVTYFLGQESKVAKEAWDFQQSKIEQLQEHLDSYKEKIEHLKAELSQQNVQLMHARQNIKILSSANEKLDIEREKLKLRGECE